MKGSVFELRLGLRVAVSAVGWRCIPQLKLSEFFGSDVVTNMVFFFCSSPVGHTVQ